MIYVVLGMHKSGTTLVSQMIHESGFSMGEHFDEGISYDGGNQWERREAFLINLDLMECTEDEYVSMHHSQLHAGPLPASTRARMAAMIEACEGEHGDWGFKDPLTCLTYPLWAEVLPAHRVVGIYRSPSEVMNHYQGMFGKRVRTIGVLWQALTAWTNYNRGVLEAVRTSGRDGLLIRYEELMSGDDEFRRLERFLGTTLNDMRRSSHYRARATHSLYAPFDRLMSHFSEASPARILAELEAVREEQRAGGLVSNTSR